MEKGSPFNAAAVADPTVRKLYRVCVDGVKQLDQSMKEKADVQSLARLGPVRKRLRDCCEKLMFINPLDFGRKADEILWRKCYYEPIKKLRQSSEVLINSESKCFLNTLVTSAIGYYHLLSLKLQEQFPSEGQTRAAFRLCTISPISKREKTVASVPGDTEKTREWCLGERHRILIYQGDLARYLHDVDETVDIRMAQHYYHQALNLKPSNGTPFNQMGTLFLTTNYGLDAAYYYLRCISSEDGFTGAVDNFLTLLNKIEQQLEPFLTDQHDQDQLLSGTAETDLKYFILVFLATSRILYLDETQSNENGTVQSYCARTLHAFCNALKYFVTVDQPVKATITNSLNFDLVLKTFVIQMLLLAKLQREGSMKLSPALALFLSMFANFLTHIINDFCHDLTKHREGPGNGRDGKSQSEILATAEVDPAHQADFAVKTAVKKQALTRRRRRRGDGDIDNEDDDAASSCSSVESEDALNGGGLSVDLDDSSSSDDVVELSDDDELGLGKLVAKNGRGKRLEKGDGTPTDSDSAASSKLKQQQQIEPIKPLVDLETSEKVEILSTYTPLVPLKIICDWFRCNPNLLLLVQQNSRELWPLLARFLNFLPDDRQLANFVESDSRLVSECKETPISTLNEWVQKYPLPEDVMLHGASPLSQVHGTLDYLGAYRRSLESEAIVRICCLRGFGHYLMRLNTPGLRFDRARLEFISNNGQTIVQDCNESDKKAALMRSMAQLRLKGEMETAEQLAWIPVYLVPDALVLCHKLALVKKLASAQKFIIVIPTVTINELDRMKKDSSTARSTTRWLEMQFRRGNKFVRMQKSTEKDDALVVGDIANIGELPASFVDILKCAVQLRKLVKAGTTSGSTIVTMLTTYSASSKEYEQAHKCLEAGNLTGVSVAHITHFYDLWNAHRKRGS